MAWSLRNARRLSGSAATLVGLLFVAVSIQIGRIAKSPIFRARAWANTFLIVMLAVNAAFVLTPQNPTALGIELCIPAGLHPVPYQNHARSPAGRSSSALATVRLDSSQSGGDCGGVSLIMRRGGGIYLVTLEFLAIVVWVMFGAW
jgi:modulator of FtsH protease